MADNNSNQNPFGLSLMREQLKAPMLNSRGTEMLPITLDKPKLDVRGIKNGQPKHNDRGLIPSNNNIQQFVKLAEQFLDVYRHRISKDAAAMNISIADKDFDFAKKAVRNAKVLSLNEAKKIDSNASPSDFAFYLSGNIYLNSRFVDLWLQNNEEIRVWEELIHESKHALLDSALRNTNLSEDNEHLIHEWLFPYYIN